MPVVSRQVAAEPLWLALTLTLLLLSPPRCSADPSACWQDGFSRAVLQLQNMYTACPPGDRNGIVAACGVAFRALTSKVGTVTLIPLVEGKHNWRGPGPATSGTFECKDLNATGLLIGRSKTEAQITLYNDLGGPLSRLAATPTGMVSLTLAHTYSWQAPPPTCTFTYKVVSGCFLGITAPPERPPCSPGTYVQRGRGGYKYCAPCPAGRTSVLPNSRACSRCPKGTYKAAAGGTCLKCDPGTYAPRPGATACQYCSGDNSYTDGVICKRCPKGSFVVAATRRQCHVCNGRRRCCRVGAAADCPPCPKGFKPGQPATSLFAFISANPPACAALAPAICISGFNVTITPTCTLTWTPYTSQDVNRAFCYGSTDTPWSGRTLYPYRDFNAFSAYTDSLTITANLTAITPPYLTFTFRDLANCSYTYRALTTPAAALLGVPPAACRPGQPGCAALPAAPALPICPAGNLPRRTVNDTYVCVPCPPGYYSSRDGSDCTPCPAGSYATGYGNVACQTCAPGTSAPSGSNTCQPCLEGSYAPDGADKCTPCPVGSSKAGWWYCLGNHLGTMCCAAGVCQGPPCPSTITDPPTNHAILQLQSISLPSPACKAADFLGCLQPGAQLGASFHGGIQLRLQPIDQPRCVSRMKPPQVFQLSGDYNDVNNATLESTYTPHPRNFTLLSWRVNNTFDLFLTDAQECTATFTLASGFLMDQAATSQAACPAATVTTSIEGRTFCSVCDQGQNITQGTCVDCPGGSSQPLYGVGACSRCVPGTAGSGAACNPCEPGSYAHRGWPSCRPCPRNTYSAASAEDCTPCPKGTSAPAGASACSTPFRNHL